MYKAKPSTLTQIYVEDPYYNFVNTPEQHEALCCKGKVNISVIAGTTAPCDPNGFRHLWIYVNDGERGPVKIQCVKLSDAGICCDLKPEKPGRYTVNLSYTFEVKDDAPVDAKMLILDGRFSGYPDLTQNVDGSWSTGKDGLYFGPMLLESGREEVRKQPLQSAIPEEETSEEFEVSEKKVSLAKQLNRRGTLTQLLGVEDVTVAARKLHSLEEVAEIMKRAGLKSSNLIFGVDYTASNKTQGLKTFSGKSLHTVDPTTMNPYQQVISILGRTLASFHNQPTIPAYGFGDVKTSDHGVFPIEGVDGFCNDFNHLLEIYNTATPKIILSGPTNFAPIIREAIDIYKKDPDYYLLVIVADGQVNNEPDTVQAICEACDYPISIIVVGVGDGPWGMMNEFDERLPARKWDNFNFVNFHYVIEGERHPEAAFAVHALVEIPDQYAMIQSLGLLKKD